MISENEAAAIPALMLKHLDSLCLLLRDPLVGPGFEQIKG